MSITGRIVKAISGTYSVAPDDRGSAVICKPRGRMRFEKVNPLVGDRVRFEENTIIELLPRRNSFARPPVANLDALVILVSAVPPITDPYVLDLLINFCENEAVEPIIVINKCDIDDYAKLYSAYSLAGFTVLRVSALENTGLAELSAAISNKTVAFTGDSGVGKTSLLNSLSELKLKTGEVSQKLKRGRHTTRHTELYDIGGGTFVADSAGFSSVEAKIPTANNYREFAEYSERCRFADCRHHKEPDCAVQEAVESGKLPRVRYENYLRLLGRVGER
ncbi:MAG: ribosome small subunit-dependent GTPase A [Oscillospiraceae bacterium]|jgi:ribosome biogenesis GTPase|nr:ribosome small subunit-dependent GTPase A [Oscillospiraceae bacterium]